MEKKGISDEDFDKFMVCLNDEMAPLRAFAAEMQRILTKYTNEHLSTPADLVEAQAALKGLSSRLIAFERAFKPRMARACPTYPLCQEVILAMHRRAWQTSMIIAMLAEISWTKSTSRFLFDTLLSLRKCVEEMQATFA